MITQNVASGCQLTTVNSNDITAVNFSDGYYYFFIRNDSEDLIIRASTTDANCSEDGDGVLSILPGQSAGLYGSGNSLLFVSSGPCIIAASNNAINPFKVRQGGGDKAKLGTIPDITSNGPVLAADYKLDGITDFIVNVPDSCEIADIGTITENGIVKASDYELDGILSLDVQVTDPHTFTDITVTENGSYSAESSGVSGYSNVNVNIVDPHSFADIEVTENGSYIAEDEGVSGFASVNVNVPDPHSFAEKVIDTNGDYNAENDGVSGFSRVSVNVPDPHTFKTKNVTENGTYYADNDGASGYSSVNVNVPDTHTFTDITVTENGSYSAENAGVSGFSNVEVDVTDPHTFKTRDIIANGTYNASSDNCSGYSSVNVNVPDPHTFSEKSITKNGTYNAANDGVSGFSSVSVNIPLTSKDITSNGAYVNSGGGWNTLNVNVPDPHTFGTLTAASNKTYNAADAGFSGYSSVIVNVPDPHTFTTKTINANGTYNATDDGASGFSSVNVSLPIGVHTAIENGTYYASDEGLAGFSRFDVCIEDPHTFGAKSIYAGGTYNAADDGLSGFSSVSVNCDYRGSSRLYIFDECKLVGVNYAYYGANTSGLTRKQYMSMKRCPISIVLDETARDYWYFAPTAANCTAFSNTGKSYKGLGLSTIFQNGVSSKVRISCGPYEDNITYSNIIDLSNYKITTNPSSVLFDIVIPFDNIFNNGSTDNVWDTSYRFLKFEAVEGSIITFNRVWFNTTSTLSCNNP